MLAEIERTLPPLGGIVHAAGVLDDGVLLEQNWQRFERVLAPKVGGAWNLHVQSQHLGLDWFVLFSSAASVLGSAGQANYAAANAFLDALAHERRRVGLPAISINWGPWSDVGMAARLGQRGERQWHARGVQLFTSEQAMHLFEEVLRRNPDQVGVFDVHWPTYMAPQADGLQPSVLRGMIGTGPYHAMQPAAEGPRLSERLKEAAPSERLDLLQTHVRLQVATVLGLSAAEPLDPRQPLHEVGLDSLGAIELRNRLNLGLERPLPATVLFEHPTIEALASLLYRELQPDGASAPHTPPRAERTDADSTAPLASIESLSDQEVEALIIDELARVAAGDRRD